MDENDSLAEQIRASFNDVKMGQQVFSGDQFDQIGILR